MKTITMNNPVLPGFYSDPFLCRVLDDFYLATSPFEYFPGVAIHKSTNLRDWDFCTCALRRTSQLDMEGDH